MVKVDGYDGSVLWLMTIQYPSYDQQPGIFFCKQVLRQKFVVWTTKDINKQYFRVRYRSCAPLLHYLAMVLRKLLAQPWYESIIIDQKGKDHVNSGFGGVLSF